MIEFLPTNSEKVRGLNNSEQYRKEFEVFEKKISSTLQSFDESLNVLRDLEEKLPQQDLTPEKRSEALESSHKVKKASQKVLKFILLRLLPIYIAYFAVAEFKEKPDGSFSEKERAKKELLKEGITSEQRSVYRLGVSEALYRGIAPWGYQGGESEEDGIPNVDAIKHFPQRVIFGREIAQNDRDIVISPAREDAWRFMLGLNQVHDTFGISDYKPAQSTEDKYYYKINGFEKKLFSNHFLGNEQWNKLSDMEKKWIKTDRRTDSKLDSLEFSDLEKHGKPLSSSLLDFVERIKANGGSIMHSDIEGDMSVGLMGHFTLSLGEDERGTYISYYDKWDLDNTFLNLGNCLARAYEIYDRIYYDPKTGEILEGPIKN